MTPWIGSQMVDPLVGVLLSTRYRIIGRLGSGETGIVWDAADELLKLSVAIKQLRLPPSASDEQRAELLDRAKAEARHSGQLAHPNIVAVYDVVSESGSLWVIMQRVTGRSLAAEIEAGGAWDPSRAARLGLQLIEALAAAHAIGVVHGAVKPSNVLIPEFGAALLTDFSLTPLHEETDLLGLGATLYFAVEGHAPPALEPAPPPNAGPIAEVIEGLLAADPAQRLTLVQARDQLAAALSAPGPKRLKTLRPLDIAAPAAAPAVPDLTVAIAAPAVPDLTVAIATPPNRRRLIIVAAVTVAAVAIAGAAFAFRRPPGTDQALPQVTASAPAAPDTTVPEQPVNVAVSGRSTDAVTLVWDAGIDNIGVTQYRVLRDGTQVGVTSMPDYTDKGLAAKTTYTYVVTAVDAAGNTSIASVPVSATTLTVPDTAKPSAPGNPRITGRSTTSIVLVWTAATDDVGVARYEVRRDGAPIATVAGLRYTDIGLAPGTSHSYVLVAIDATGNVSDPTAAVTAMTLIAPDTTAPSTPGSLHVTGQTTTTIGLAWAASSDNIGVTGYLVYRNGILVDSATTLAYTDTGLTPGTSYGYQVKATDGAGNVSAAALISAATVAPQVSGINAEVSVGAIPGCTVTVTATVSVTAGPVTVDLQTTINGVTSNTSVSFTGTGAQSQTVNVGTGVGTQDGNAQVSSTSPNPVTSNAAWTAPDACRPGFAVTSPTAEANSCGSPTITGSVRVTAKNNPEPQQYMVQMLIDGNAVADTTITLAPNSFDVVSLTSPDQYPTGAYAVSFVVTDQGGSSATSATVNTEVNCS